jgi:glutaminyl-tRNA synthetase
MEPNETPSKPIDFIRKIINEDLRTGKNGERVATRFPPEPNGYLHIGHAKSININFGIALEYHGACHMRFDDTNPEKEDMEYINAIKQDVHWLGFDWGPHLYNASDYFEQFYQYAVELIKKGLAYVCDLSPDEIREYRGTLTQPGKDSPFRNRSVEENLERFDRMRQGGFAESACVLRAKIDMASPNMNMRDPALYRIKHASHPHTGDKWHIYPMYDFAHCISDSIERITHSICTLEFEDHRPLYDWILDNISVSSHPQQIEFARLNLTYTVMSKRKLLQLVRDHFVLGWNDPRMPTLSGLRRRGYTPEAIRNFCNRIGIDKTNSTVDFEMLEYYVREDLNLHSHRVMAVLRPLKVVLENYPENQVEEFEAENNPEDPAAGTRKIIFSRELYIEQEDFREVPPKGYFRLSPGKEVRLKHAYYITCTQVIKNAAGEITELRCTYDPASRGGSTPDNRKVQGTLHWVSAGHALEAEIRLYDKLFTKPNPDEVAEGASFTDNLNPASLTVLNSGKLEQSLKSCQPGDRFQFMRNGYFCVDPDSATEKLVFNQTVGLKDTWAKMQKMDNGK